MSSLTVWLFKIYFSSKELHAYNLDSSCIIDSLLKPCNHMLSKCFSRLPCIHLRKVNIHIHLRKVNIHIQLYIWQHCKRKMLCYLTIRVKSKTPTKKQSESTRLSDSPILILFTCSKVCGKCNKGIFE